MILLCHSSSPALSCHRQLQDAPSLLPQAHIYILAFLIFCKDSDCFTLITVYLPASGTFTVVSGVLDKTDHISQRISQKNSDLMREFLLNLQLTLK